MFLSYSYDIIGVPYFGIPNPYPLSKLQSYLAVSINCGVLCVGVLVIRALLLGVCIGDLPLPRQLEDSKFVTAGYSCRGIWIGPSS